MGLLGTLLGLALGWGIAQFTVRAIAQTVNTLYFHSTTEAASWHWGEAALAGLLGLTASALAGWLPARDAAATPPAQMLQRGNRSDGFRWLLRPSVGVALVGLALVAHQLPPWRTADGGATPWAGYLAAFLWVGGAGILAGQLFAPLARWGQKGSSRQPSRFYAASQLREATGRHRLATAGLVVAVAMAGGMSILVSSFETTVTRWLDQVMKADLFVASQGSNSQASHQRLQASLWQALWNAPEVVDGHLSQSFEIDFEAQHTRLTGIATKQEGSLLGPIWLKRPASPFLQTTPSSARTQGVISEPFAHRFQRDVGDVLVLPTPLGPQEVEVVGIYADYGNEFGNVIIPLATLHQWFQDDRVRRLSVTLREDASLEALQARWRQDHPGIVVTDQRTLRNEALRIFHQTFAVTHGLKWIGIAVAMAGLGLALASMLMERERELMTLRALGLTRKGIGQSAAWESLGMATAGLIGGLFLSLILGHLIIYVINRQSFGWTLLFQIPWREFLWLGAGLLAISALTGGFTAQRVMRVPTDQPSTRTE
jgi:putative ABC transport system permease protein